MVRIYDRASTANSFLQDGGSGYKTGREGNRFFVSNPTVTTGETAQTTFVDTTPYLLFDTDTSTRIIPFGLILAQAGTVAGGVITIVLAIDSINRYVSSGTELTPKNTNMALSVTTGVTA